MNLGYFTPFHPIPGISSGQYDLSLEHHIRGTGSELQDHAVLHRRYKLADRRSSSDAASPRRYHTAKRRIWAPSSSFNKGDFSRNGLSGQLSVTYTNAIVQFQGLGGAPNQISVLNNAVSYFNALTKFGRRFALLHAGEPSDGTVRTRNDQLRRRLGKYPQPVLHDGTPTAREPICMVPRSQHRRRSEFELCNPNLYQAPWVSSLILNYRHNGLAVTPSLQLDAGTRYGEPMDVVGVDPRSCAANSLATKVPGAGLSFPATQCNYTTHIVPGASPYGYLYIPNPQTGTFANFGEYVSPSIVVGNLSLSYDHQPEDPAAGRRRRTSSTTASAARWKRGREPIRPARTSATTFRREITSTISTSRISITGRARPIRRRTASRHSPGSCNRMARQTGSST